jgi:hypothetical protein
MLKVVLCGSPHSGKSCLREGLKQAIMPVHWAGLAPYPYVLTACPDGEGSWYSEAARNNPELAKQLKQAYKSKFTPEFVRRVTENVQTIRLPITLIDIGGVIDDKNRQITDTATHAIILAGDCSQIPAWQAFCAEQVLEVIAILESNYDADHDRVDSEVPLLTGMVHHLERGEDVSDRPMVQALAKRLIKLCKAQSFV